jgi:mRNA-degrading endonuclease RelE of RelBE toxin-antitoxin system
MYEIFRTDSFLEDVKKQKKNKQLLNELDKKIQKLKENSHNIGGNLSGRLAGFKSTRLVKNFTHF